MKWAAALVLTLLCSASLLAQDDDELPPERAMKPPVLLAFTPPDLQGPIVLGIFDSAGKLRRTLRFASGAPELFIDTNGYIVKWDGLDDDGKPCAPGRYSARGYMVDQSVSVEGVAYHFNDWFAEDHVAAASVSLLGDVSTPELAILVKPQLEPHEISAQGQLIALPQPDGSLRWDRRPPPKPGVQTTGEVVSMKSLPHLEGKVIESVAGRDGTLWAIVEVDGRRVVRQFAPSGEILRELKVPAEEPQPVQIRASCTEDLILLAENSPDKKVQRVRMLRRAGESVANSNGRPAANWEVVFERELAACEGFNIVNGKLVAGDSMSPSNGVEGLPPNEITIPLVQNVLEPGQKKLKLKAVAAQTGSLLAAAEGLPLIPVSAEGRWSRFALVKGQEVGEATLYQANSCVVEEFALKNLDRIAAFDAGAFLLAPASQ